MRTFSGKQEFEALKQTVSESYQKVFPVEKNGYRMELKNIWVDDTGADVGDFTSQKKARLAGHTWGAPLYGHILLKDSTGNVVDEISKQRLATIPRLTPRGSYIVGGNEYQVNNQLRRRAGVYVVKRAAGNEFKANVKTTGEGGRDFEIHFDPTTNRYTLGKIGKDLSSLPLYPLLRALNVSDEELKKNWGDKIFEANKMAVKTGANQKLAQKLTGKAYDAPDTAEQALRDYALAAKIDPEMAEITLGKKHDHLHPEILIGASNKLLGAYKGTAQVDDPESLLFKEVLSVEDMIKDKFERKNIKELKFTLGRHLGKETSLKKLINVQRLTSPIESFFSTDDRSSTPEQYNPVQMLSNRYKLTMTGTGGITDPHTIPQEVREVHPSHMGFIDPTHTPDSGKIGTMLHLTAGIVKDGKNVKTRVWNTRKNIFELLSPLELSKHVVAFPENFEFVKDKLVFKTKEVRAQRQGRVDSYPTSQVEYVIPSQATLFSFSTNLVPFLHNDQGNRVMMASKMLEQAIPLVHREAPLVQTAVGDGKTFQQFMGEGQTVYAPHEGAVTAVTADAITIGNTKIPIYNDFPLNQKTFIHHESKVKVGDKVKKGQILADSNFTKNGTLAIGKNMNVAYVPFPGLTFEDGIVITESAAKKLATQQIYRNTYKVEKGKAETNLKRFHSLQPGMVGTKDRALYDEDGVIKKGSIVRPGQLTIMGVKYQLDSLENASLKRINKALQSPWVAQPVRYTGEFEGVVTDVVKRGDQVEVFVKAVEIARESDKLSGVHGNKGVITKVIPDHEAPRTKDGMIPDIFLNPHGIIGRINPGQLYEAAAAKIAKKTGKTYVVKNFDGKPTDDTIIAEMKKHGVTDMEEMILPNGKSMGKVSVGSPYILRLAKTGKSGFSARMPGTGYDQNMQPTKGGEEGTKSMDLMTFYSMLSHGAKKNLADAHQKSEMNDEYWRALEMGRTLPAPKPTFVFNKFLNMLRGAGINPQKQGSEIALAPMTDHEVKKLSNGKISEYNFFLGKDMSPKKGGFFDQGITGGKFGERFAHIELPESMPNPIFERAIKTLAGINEATYKGIVNGTVHVSTDGKIGAQKSVGDLTGGKGIAHLLSRVDVDHEIVKTQQGLKNAKEDDLNNLNKKLRYLTALKELNMAPQEAYMRKLVPVIPPVHRPAYEMPGRGLVVAPANYLYQRLGVLSQSHDYPVMKLLKDEDKKELREDTYKATKELAGLEDVTTRGKDVPIKGFISEITGDSPKTGFFLQKVISKRQDLVGRGVITAGPDLGVDELGIPEKMAWKIFHPFIMREYSLAGVTPITARKEIEEKAPRAKTFLQAAMNKRTVMMNRAPSLHKFSIMSFRPVVSDGLAIRVPPLVLKGFGGDFDGDAVTIHVPTSEDALRESHKMFPSRNLFKPGSGELMMMPSQESAIGLYFLSQTPKGRAEINALLPKQFHITGEMSSAAAKALYNKIANEDPKAFSTLVMVLKNLGDKTAYESGFSVGIKDIAVNRKPRDLAFAQADKEVAAIKKATKSGAQQDHKVSEIYREAAERGFNEISGNMKGTDNGFYHMVTSGARGNKSQLMQLVSAPGVMKDAKDRMIPTPVKRSYAEGLHPSDYFIAAYGVRKGMMDRALQTSEPGALNKDLMVSAIDNIVTEADCGTHKGITLPINSRDVHERYLSYDQHGLPRNTLVTPQVLSQLGKKNVSTLVVRSPLECLSKKGTCAHCFGLNEHNALPELGDNVGAVSGQAMSEPMTQLVMRTFHTGGVASGPSTAQGFERLKQLLKMPDKLAGEATLATKAGTITKITPSPAGGHEIHVGNQIHAVRPGLSVRVKVGDTVEPGDMMSTGVIKPQNLVKYKGMKAAQNYLVDEIKKVYDESMKENPMKRRTIETAVRSFGNLTRVVSAPKGSDFAPGDLIPFTVANHYNETRKLTSPVGDAVGLHLQAAVGKLTKGHELTDKDIPYLRSMGHTEIPVVQGALVHAPILKSIERLPSEKKNWMAQIGYRYIKDTLTEGASQRWKSDVEGNNPIPAYAYGATFGKKKDKY